MRSSEPKLIVSDMAGTTIEDNGAIAEAFRLVFGDISDEQLSAIRGRSKREAVMALSVSVNAYRELQAAIREIWSRKGVRALPGAKEFLERHRVALTTGFDRDTAAFLIEALGWQKLAPIVITADDVALGRPAPYMIFRAMEAAAVISVADVAAIGDTTADLEAGANAGVRWNVGVLTGAHTRMQLEAAPHTDIIHSIADWNAGCQPAGPPAVSRRS
jgi:phosphonatase-like hydrolase